MKAPQKKFLKISGYTFLALIVILCVHIYVVTRPKAPSPNSRVMARIDMNKKVSSEEQQQITNWMYAQKGIDHVLCNAEAGVLVFTFFPAKADANNITSELNNSFHMNAQRFVPTEAQMKASCPLETPGMDKAITYFKQLF